MTCSATGVCSHRSKNNKPAGKLVTHSTSKQPYNTTRLLAAVDKVAAVVQQA